MKQQRKPEVSTNAEFLTRSDQDFERVFHQNHLRIYRFLLSSLHDRDLAEALTQECFLNAYRSWSEFRGKAQVSTWLTRIAINLQRDYWRSRRMKFWRETCANSLIEEEILERTPESGDSPERTLVAKQQVVQVWKAVSELTHKQRSVFLLRVVEELNLKEIANVMGMPEGTVKAHLFHGMHKIREVLGDRA